MLKQILKIKPKYALELAYEAVIELIDALLALEGFKSWSHEASIAFLSKIKLPDVKLKQLDIQEEKDTTLNIMGVDFALEEAEPEISFMEKLFEEFN